jgi:hypothetical protein
MVLVPSTLVPVIGLVQVGAQSRADRYTYLPLVGVFIAVAWLLGDMVDRASRTAEADRQHRLNWRACLLVPRRRCRRRVRGAYVCPVGLLARQRDAFRRARSKSSRENQ